MNYDKDFVWLFGIVCLRQGAWCLQTCRSAACLWDDGWYFSTGFKKKSALAQHCAMPGRMKRVPKNHGVWCKNTRRLCLPTRKKALGLLPCNFFGPACLPASSSSSSFSSSSSSSTSCSSSRWLLIFIEGLLAKAQTGRWNQQNLAFRKWRLATFRLQGARGLPFPTA